MIEKNEFVTIARIAKPQGRHGEVIADILTDFPESFAQRKRLFLLGPSSSARREMELEGFWLHKGRVVLKFMAVDSIADAAKLAGHDVQVRQSERIALEPGSFYVSDLVGCTVWDQSSQPPREVGTVEAIEKGAGAAPLLNVRKGKAEYQLPFAEEFIKRVDTENKILELTLPAGLLEINGPLSQEEKNLFNRKQQDEI